MRYTSYLLLSSLLLLAVLLAGCVPDSTPAGVTEPTPWPTIGLEGTEWLLTAVAGVAPLADVAPVAGTAPTLAFHPDNYLEANSGCNYLGVDYATEGNAFTLAEIHRTAFDCAEPAGVADQDVAFFEAFGRIAAYGATQDVLVFQDADGTTLLEYARKRPPAVDAALVDTEWVLTAIYGQPPLEGTRITLNLGAEHYGGLAGCNSYGGTYVAASHGALTLGEIAVTAMLCTEPEGVMEQEGAYTQALGQAAGYRVSGDTLEILDAAGEVVLAYSRQPTYDTDPAALIGTAWQATPVDGEVLDVDAPLTLVFYREGILGGHAGCRDYVGSYTMTGDNLALVYMAMLDPGCDTDALAGEGTLLNVLTDSAAVELDGERLVLHGEHGGKGTLEAMDPEDAQPVDGTLWSFL
ncbi:MAG: META domain-containing protein, partial [Chloroflexi bacterium]|nr:META domain-containing protein [Chloroflexota bacterium]